MGTGKAKDNPGLHGMGENIWYLTKGKKNREIKQKTTQKKGWEGNANPEERR